MGRKINKGKNKKKKNKEKVFSDRLDWIMKIIAIGLLAIIVLWINKYTKKQQNNAKVIEESFFQYIEDRRIDYKADLTLSITGQIMNFEIKDSEISLDSTPIYYSEKDKMIFTQDMAIIFPNRNGLMKKIRKYTPISNEWYGVYLNDSTKDVVNNIDITQAFIYDASDTYVFPNEVTIVANGESYQLSPLSYVIVAYKEYLEIFDKDTQAYTFVDLEDSDDVIAKNDYYELNLSTDVLYNSGKEQLLLKNMNYLDYVEE